MPVTPDPLTFTKGWLLRWLDQNGPLRADLIIRDWGGSEIVHRLVTLREQGLVDVVDRSPHPLNGRALPVWGVTPAGRAAADRDDQQGDA